MTQTPTAPLDPVTAYAAAAVAGRIVTSRLVRLACQRHLDDVAGAPANGLVWNADEAQRVIDFFPAILNLPENVAAGEDDVADSGAGAPQPFVLQPWQQFIAGSLIGWHTVKGYRRFRLAYIEAAKGSGKTPLAAGLMIFKALADGERGAQVYFAATKLEQAKIPFADVEAMVASSPSLKKRLLPTVNNFADPKTRSFLRAISSEKHGLDGKRVSACHLEELHEQPTGIVVLKMRAGVKGRRNALIVETTNAGFNRTSVCWNHHEYSRNVLEGLFRKDHWFAFVAQLDPCERCRKAGRLFPQDDCRDCDDWRVEGPHWLKPNPNMGVSLHWEYLRETVTEAIDMPSDQGMVKRLNFGLWTDQVTIWITPDRWDACRAPAIRVPTRTAREAFIASTEGRECYVGGDISSKIDLTSLVLIFPRPLEGLAGSTASDALTRAIDVVSYFWMPDKTLQARAVEDNMPYPEWRDQGFLFTNPGLLINRDAIADFLLGEAERRKWKIRGIGIDQAGAADFITRLQGHFGDELVTEVPQGFKMLDSPSKTYEALIISGQLRHDGNPVQTMCVTNMGKEENTWRSIRPVKLNPRRRIDGGVALIDAICTMERTPVDDSESVYEKRGLSTI